MGGDLRDDSVAEFGIREGDSGDGHALIVARRPGPHRDTRHNEILFRQRPGHAAEYAVDDLELLVADMVEEHLVDIAAVPAAGGDERPRPGLGQSHVVSTSVRGAGVVADKPGVLGDLDPVMEPGG